MFILFRLSYYSYTIIDTEYNVCSISAVVDSFVPFPEAVGDGPISSKLKPDMLTCPIVSDEM